MAVAVASPMHMAYEFKTHAIRHVTTRFTIFHKTTRETYQQTRMLSRKTIFVKQVTSTVLYMFPVLPGQCRLWSVEWGGVQSVECEDSEDSEDSGVLRGECNVQGMNQ
jgi:hypothetical protein